MTNFYLLQSGLCWLGGFENCNRRDCILWFTTHPFLWIVEKNAFSAHNKCNTMWRAQSVFWMFVFIISKLLLLRTSFSSHLGAHRRRAHITPRTENCLTHVIQYRGSFHECSVWFIQVDEEDVVDCRLLAGFKQIIYRSHMCTYTATWIYNITCDAVCVI